MSIVKLTLSSKLAAFICQRTDFFLEKLFIELEETFLNSAGTMCLRQILISWI